MGFFLRDRALDPEDDGQPPIRPESALERAIDREIADLARAQRGMVSRRQLRELGLGEGAIDHRVRSGRLEPHFRGVYLFGAVVPDLGEEQSALLVAGEGAHLGGGTAARVFQLAAGGTQSPIEILLVGRDLKSRDGLVVHRVASLVEDEVTEFEGLPITTPARTIFDVTSRLSLTDLERAIADAWRRKLVKAGEMERLVEQHRGERGVRALRKVLQLDGGPAFTRREAEELLLELIRNAGLPTPACNVWVCGQQVDFAWLRERLILEFDGFAYHSDRIAFERDRARDARLIAGGYRVLRITWRRLRDQPYEVIAEIAAALSAR